MMDFGKLPCTLEKGIARRTVIVPIVLAADQTVEHEFRRLGARSPAATPSIPCPLPAPGCGWPRRWRRSRPPWGLPVTSSDHALARHCLRLAGVMDSIGRAGRLFRYEDDSMSDRHSFFCIDGHTCGNPVRLVAGGGPFLKGATMSARRQDFIGRYDWIRRALMFEPRGHSVMSGSILYPPLREDCDAAILFIEVSGCLPMCGHGTIGTVTLALENGLIYAAREGTLALDTPAGRVVAEYVRNGSFIDSVRIRNVPSYLAASEVRIACPELGELVVDVAYGGNFYAIIERQPNYPGLEEMSAGHVLRLSPIIRELVNRAISVRHPEDPTIHTVTHVQWTGASRDRRAHGRNAVFYGSGAIDRSPCGTGTSARMAQLAARGLLGVGDEFVHESIIGSLFHGRVEAAARVGDLPAIVPSISGWARMHGLNTIFVDRRDPFALGFEV